MLIRILMQNAGDPVVTRSAHAAAAQRHPSCRAVVRMRAEATSCDIFTGTELAVDRLVGKSRERRDGYCHPMDAAKVLFSPNTGQHVLTKEWHIRRRFSRRMRLLQIPQDLRGWTVLDIGAWGGIFSFECERRGAERVLAIDTYAWDTWGMDTFLAERERLHSKVEYRRLDAHEIDPREIGQFDLILFLGVFYHLHTPLLALERIASVTKKLLICDTHVLLPFVHERYPLVSFFPGDERATGKKLEICAIPTMECLRQMLAFVGFTQIDVKYAPSFRYWKKFVALVTNTPQSGRGIVHARF